MKIINAIKSKTRQITTPKAKRAAAPPVAQKTAPKTKAKPGKISAPKAKRATVPAVQITTEQIARKAYSIWEQQGRPAGMDSVHWLQAEQQLKSSQSFTE